MPLLKHGLPVEPVQIESATSPQFLDRYRLLLLTYEGQKPPSPAFHDALAKWVRAGGALLIVDDARDPYCAVGEWWNTPPFSYRTPRQHLFEALGLPKDATGLHRVDRGVILRQPLSPASLTYNKEGADSIRRLAKEAAAAVGLEWQESNALVLRRGPYVVAAGLDESLPSAKSFELHGHFIDLFDASLPVRTDLALSPGKRALLFDLDAVKSSNPKVLAAACKVSKERFASSTLSFSTEGIADTQAVVRMLAPHKPSRIMINGQLVPTEDYTSAGSTLQLRFPNSVSGVPVDVEFVP